jgi:hypothetical protein
LELPAIYQGAAIQLAPAEYCADVAPRPTGDHQISLSDWQEVGRMVAGLDVPTNSDEMLRADCAPRNAPDGVLTVADWVQAGRYYLGLDPYTLVTPPAAPNAALKAKPRDGVVPSRILQVATVSAARGQTVSLPVSLVCSTNENAVGLTLTFPTNHLRLLGVALGSAFSGGKLTINSNQVAGHVGLLLALMPGHTLSAGTNQVAVLQFAASAGASGAVPVTLDNSVARLQVADVLATSLATTYVSGAVVLPPQPALAVTETGKALQFSWQLAAGTFQVQTAEQPIGPWTTLILPLITNGANVSCMCSLTNQAQFFRLQGQ